MNMLTPYQVELIQCEIDGENTPEASAEVQRLVETQPEALALMTSLRSLDSMFSEIPDRAVPPHVRQAIDKAVSLNSRASPKAVYAQERRQTITGWAIQQWNGVTNLMEKSMLTKRVLIGATTAVAVIAIIGYLVVDYKPTVYDAGTVGAGSGMSGVQQAGRFKGRTMTEADVSLSNPEIGALLQNDKILKLVQSKEFRDALNSDAFRELESSDQFHVLLNSDAFHTVLASDAAHALFLSDAFQQVLANDAAHALFASDAAHMLFANDASHQVSAVATSDAAREVAAVANTEALRELLANDAARETLASDNFRAIFANDNFRAILANDNFREILASDAFHQLESSDTFRQISQSDALSQAFLNEASHVSQ
jgi:hypothetical protein